MTTTRWAVVRLGCALGAASALFNVTACGRLAGDGAAPGVGGGAQPGAGGGGPAMLDPGPVAACQVNASLAPARISLLSDAQFTNAVHDVFGVDLVVPVPDHAFGNYPLTEDASVASLAVVQGYMQRADQVASRIKPCGASAPDAACMEAFLRRTLPRAWRRPVEDDEIAGIVQLFKAGLDMSPDRALRVTIEAVLMSGSFLYRTEIGQHPPSGGETSVALTPHELASAVSFGLGNSLPDAELDAKAQDGSITEPSVLGAEVDRLLATDAVQANLQKKVSYYLGLERFPMTTKDTARFPAFTTSLTSALYQGAQQFLGEVMQQGHFSDLFTSHRIYANREVAAAYDLPAVAGFDLVALDIPGPQRSAGILTQPAFLATTNEHFGDDDIVHRGLFVYNSFICGIALGPPPPEEDAFFATLMGTDAEKARQRDKREFCGSCHNSFDPFGLATETYDPIGRYRATDPDDPGHPIDVSASIARIGPDMDGPIDGINDLASRLAKGRRASDCAALHLLTMTVDHHPTEEPCALEQMKSDFLKNGSFPQLFKAIVTSPAFLTRDWAQP